VISFAGVLARKFELAVDVVFSSTALFFISRIALTGRDYMSA
jgi:hypothetical protein